MTEQALDPLLFGANTDEGLVAVEHIEKKSGPDEIVLFVRRGEEIALQHEPFKCFIVAELAAIENCPVEFDAIPLQGRGRLNLLAVFPSWKQCQKAKTWLAATTRRSPGAPSAPYLYLNDPVHQHLLLAGRTLMKGLHFEDLHRMQVDIECVTTEGYEFCNAERDDDRIVAIALSDQSGWVHVLSGAELDEKSMLQKFVALVRERDPDVIEGHNLFNFDLPYISKRAARHRVKLALGRDGSTPRHRPSRLSFGERTIAYERFEIFGRNIVDTLFLAHAYDISHRSLSGLGLKEVAVHFGLAAPDRTYIEGSRISDAFRERPEEVMRYVRDDVVETRNVGNLLSRSSFVQAAMLPYSYQNICVRGSAAKVDALMIREYLRNRRALPKPDERREFAGGYTDMFVEGIVQNVHHCDVRSLYPSLMLTRKLQPGSDELGVFLKLLDRLRTFRLDAKGKMTAAGTGTERMHYDALQAAFKILINSFYGYLGFSQARFNDFEAAEEVTAKGRELLRNMIAWLSEHGAEPIEIDTDGIYFVPPAFEGGEKARGAKLEAFRQEFAGALPEGIEIEFDGEYLAMYSYKMKNYALLDANGEMVIKGAALKSRGLEPFQRAFLRETIRLKLEGRERRIAALKTKYETAIREHQWPIAELAKTETLQESPSSYAEKIGKGKRARSATYELAIKSERDYRAGDQISYYVTGHKKSVSVHEAARLVTDWDPANRDENIPYYLAKLEALYAKFAGADTAQGELELGS